MIVGGLSIVIGIGTIAAAILAIVQAVVKVESGINVIRNR